MRKFIFVLSLQILWYLCWALTLLDANFLPSLTNEGRGFYVFIGVFILIFSSVVYFLPSGELHDLFKSPTHEEKKSSIKEYIGELQEELNLYSEAKDLERRVNELRKSKS